MTITRKPWERRLEDLAHLLDACGKTYFAPDLFRRNTNQFLQTARTITFIIQKNKADIPDFNNWYRAQVLNAWSNDLVMTWAKDARNTIEKEGDLDINSTLSVSLIYSYLEEEDVVVPCGRDELVGASVQQLIQFAKQHLPAGIADAAGIRIARSWVTVGLDSWEVLQALCYIYARLFDCCRSLCTQLGRVLPRSIPEPADIAWDRDEAIRVQLVKLSDLKSYNYRNDRMADYDEDELPDGFKDRIREMRETLEWPHNFISAVAYYQNMAHATFCQWGNHISMLFLLNKDWSVQHMITPFLVDQTDKYFFWRLIGERVRVQKPYAVVFTTEVWIRDFSKPRLELAMKELPIIGECLQTSLIDAEGNRSTTTWEIERPSDGTEPTLGPPVVAEESDRRIYFLVPAMRGMGIHPNFLPTRGTSNN